MKIKFDSNQTHQRLAWESVVSVFEGQERAESKGFSMPSPNRLKLIEKGLGNRLTLLGEEEIEKNVQKIQLKNGLEPIKSKSLKKPYHFTIEMETGTGKTYVYLRSIFEMNKQYGFTKFIVVVPSIAVREGVYKTLEMTESHFKEHYNAAQLHYFRYDSKKLNDIYNFATSDAIEIMIINIDAFRKNFIDSSKETHANIIHRWSDSLGCVPIDLIKSTNPVVIIDEPQTVDSTDKSTEAIQSLNPLCTFRYSATHIHKHTMLYKLNSIDAYEQKLVKQIEVASITLKGDYNRPYIKLLAVDNKNGHRANIEIDIEQKSDTIEHAQKWKRTQKWVKQGDNLKEISKRSIYDGYVINDIYCEEGNEYIDFTSKTEVLKLNSVIGMDIDDDQHKRSQIRKTIEVHLEKELKLVPMGIKVLSLFFIDKVSNYRDYAAPDQKGKYAKMFEEEYAKLIKEPKYSKLFEGIDTTDLPKHVHGGYFSSDSNKTAEVLLWDKDFSSDSNKTAKDTTGKTKEDEDTYNLIMKDKEKLLSFDSKLKFIFSHSALKEGWDNPNVFQICTLNQTQSTLKKRQEIGRGLRICVNQQGERVYGFDVNILTVMVNEFYEDFVKALQKEIENEEGIKFGIIEKHNFANIVTHQDNTEPTFLGVEASEVIWNNLLANEYIDKQGKITDKLKKDLKENKIELPEEFKQHQELILTQLKTIARDLNIKNNDDKRTVRLNKAVFESPEFKELWDRVKYKTVYNVNFDPQKLIEKCAKAIQEGLIVGKAKWIEIENHLAKVGMNKAGLAPTNVQESTLFYNTALDTIPDYTIPDILTDIETETKLKRQSIYEILIKSNRMNDFKDNPQAFLREVKGIIKREMRKFMVDGIKYHKMGDNHFYKQELFESEELIGYLNKNMIQATKSTYDHVVYDSDYESNLAQSFERSNEVKVYTKLPSWFKIETPLGSYNPDWAVLFEVNGQEKLYFVIESKGVIARDDLRGTERDKIRCGEGHFKAIGGEVDYIVTNNYETFVNQVSAKIK